MKYFKEYSIEKLCLFENFHHCNGFQWQPKVSRNVTKYPYKLNVIHVSA